MRHGIIRERLSALATDVVRAECLERQGYNVQLLEFIDMEHTPKNILIRAVKKSNLNEKALNDQKIAEEKSLKRTKALLGELGVSQRLFQLLSD